MPSLRFHALPTGQVRAYQSGSHDAYGMIPERRVSDGPGLPCRHCLSEIAAGEEYLILAHRPFSKAQPYAETGPIFLHAKPCERHLESADTPAMFLGWERMLLRGYSQDERIVYGTGAVVASERIAATAADLLGRPEIAFVDMRSASNNCFQCRVTRG
ncbi:MAG: DUF1203 domain-containing protein [Dongiaceae bacterium]